MMVEEKPKRRPASPRSLLISLCLAVAYGLFVRLLFDLPTRGDWLNTVTLAFLLFTPFAVGALSVVLLPPQQRGTLREAVEFALVTCTLFLGSTFLFVGEAWICLVMAAPMCWPASAIGGWAMYRLLNREKPKRKRQYAVSAFVLALPFLLAPIEAQIPVPIMERIVSDTVIIRGTPQHVWAHIIRMDTITPAEQRPSFFHLSGIPRPIRATLSEERLGAIRRGEFEYGLAFIEEITIWKPYEQVHFTIQEDKSALTSMPLQQIGGPYFDILDAGYTIEPLGDGQVRLTLSSCYQLTTHFNAYAALWADWIMGDFQRYVLGVVQRRVEAAGQG